MYFQFGSSLVIYNYSLGGRYRLSAGKKMGTNLYGVLQWTIIESVDQKSMGMLRVTGHREHLYNKEGEVN